MDEEAGSATLFDEDARQLNDAIVKDRGPFAYGMHPVSRTWLFEIAGL